MSPHQNARIHATTISWQGRGALILGASGRGKSALALHLMALGCDLVADDQTELSQIDGQLIARCPRAIKGKIEARGFGLLAVDAIDQTEIACAIDLDTAEGNRLPEEKYTQFCGVNIRLFHKPGIEVLPFALLQYLKGVTG